MLSFHHRPFSPFFFNSFPTADSPECQTNRRRQCRFGVAAEVKGAPPTHPKKKKLRKRNFFPFSAPLSSGLATAHFAKRRKKGPLAKLSSSLAKKISPLYLALKRQERGVKGEERRIAFASGRRDCWMLQKVKEGRAPQEFSLVLEGIFENSYTPHG